LFNRLTGTRDALVADYPGLTRDRIYGFTAASLPPAVVIDTGGWPSAVGELADLMRAQVELAVAEADVVVMLADGQSGATSEDQYVARELRRSGKPVVLAVNKAEGRDAQAFVSDFWELGLDTPMAVSASHGDGCVNCWRTALAQGPPAGEDSVARTLAEGPCITRSSAGPTSASRRWSTG
jgi:GTP-binding protein